MTIRLHVLLLLLSLSFVMSSCADYVQVFSTKPAAGSEGYYVENRDLRLSYNFWHHRGGMQLVIENITTQPIYPDWSRSVFTLNGMVHGYENPDALPGVIPPNKIISVNDFYLWTEQQLLPGVRGGKTIINRDQLFARKQWEKTYNAEHSPLTFGHLLTYKVGTNGPEYALEQNFYVQKVIEMSDWTFRDYTELVENSSASSSDQPDPDAPETAQLVDMPHQFYVAENHPDERTENAEASFANGFGWILILNELSESLNNIQPSRFDEDRRR